MISSITLSLLCENSFEIFIQTFFRGIIRNNFHELAIGEILLSNPYKLLPEKSLETTLVNYYETNHFNLTIHQKNYSQQSL